MVSNTGDEDETQVMDIDSSPSGTQSRDPIDNDFDDGIGQDQNGGQFGETLPLDSLMGETEAQEDPDCISDCGNGEIDIWDKTQVIDDYTQVVDEYDHDDEGTERTEVLCNDEELQDDAATPCDDDVHEHCSGDHVESGLDGRQTVHEHCSGDHVERDVVVDSDVSTDEEGDAGSARKSFTAVRAASLRSFGLSAARNGVCNKMQDGAIGVHTGTKAIVMESLADGAVNPTFLGTKEDEVDMDHRMMNSNRCTLDCHRDETKNRINNSRVRKLFSEVTPRREGKKLFNEVTPRGKGKKLFNEVTPRREETTSMFENILEKRDSLPSHVGGLSYVESQEPGDLSQAHALGVVDMFLFVNDVGSSQEFEIDKTKIDIVKSPPMSSAKGAQSLAKKADIRSPVSEGGIYDWFDNLEDEGGGEFFAKRKEAFFEKRGGSRKAQSNPPKARQLSSRIFEGAVDKEGEKQGVNCKSHLKLTRLTSSDSRLMLHSASRNKELNNSETKTKRTLFKDLDEPTNSIFLEQQSVTGDVGIGEEAVCCIGPDTQMAAEAMEALFHGPPLKYEMKEDSHTVTGKVAENLDKGATKRNSLKNVSLKKLTASPASEGITARSKRRKTLSDKSGRVCDQFPARKELTLGEYQINATPVAHRTRHSRAVNSTIEREVGLVSDSSASAKSKREGCNISSVQTAKVGNSIRKHTGTRKEEANCSSLIKDSLTHPKRRRTGRIISGDRNINDNLNNPSVFVDGMPTAAAQSSARRGRPKIFVRSVSEILATAKRKRRSVSTHKPSKGDVIPVTMQLPITFGVRTRSAVNAPHITPVLEKDSMELLPRPVVRTSTSAAINCSTALKNQIKLHKEMTQANKIVDPASYVKDAYENPIADESPKEKVQLSELPSITSKAIDAVSPVCMAQEPPSTSCRKNLSRPSIVRELIRLEAFEASPSLMPKDIRRRKDMSSVRVVLSNHLDEDTIKHQKKILARLGVSVASSMSDATHFVIDKFVRTRNMLEAMALGRPVVTPMWLENCGQASCFIAEKKYILSDSKKEKEIGFSMHVSLARAWRQPLLQGRRVFITPNTKPGRELLASLVKAAHGQAMERIGRSATKDDKVPDDLLVISCEEDYVICEPLLKKGTEIFSSELLLNGVVIQKLEYDRHRLFLDHMKKTRSTTWLRHEDGSRFLPVTKCT